MLRRWLFSWYSFFCNGFYDKVAPVSWYLSRTSSTTSTCMEVAQRGRYSSLFVNVTFMIFTVAGIVPRRFKVGCHSISLTVKIDFSLSWGGSGGAGTQELDDAEAVGIDVEIVELDSNACLEHLCEVGRRLGVSALALVGLWSLAALERPEAPFCPQPIAAFARLGERSLKNTGLSS